MPENTPSPAMLAPIEKIARFMETGEEGYLTGFAEEGVSIIENFAPYLFSGPDAVARWAVEMRAHVGAISGLNHRFGPVHTFSSDGDIAYLSLPTNWTGTVDGRTFDEDGGWAFVLVNEQNEWRVRNYGWAVTRLSVE
ncbi:MAG: hypothetical protein AB7O54_11205 [Pseudomonadales bacterium]